MRYWLMKSEPDEFSIDDLAAAPGQYTLLVRRAQLHGAQLHARQHEEWATAFSSITRAAKCPASRASRRSRGHAYPDESQFDRKGEYFEPKATRENPRWMNVDVKLVKKTRVMPLEEMRGLPRALQHGDVLRRGNRLSVTPVTPAEFAYLDKLLRTP